MMNAERCYKGWIVAAGVAVFFSCLASLFLFVNLPCRDDWELVALTAKILNGEIPFSDFWAFHAEHRMFFTRLILSYWAAWTSWDMRAVPWAHAFLVLISTLCLSRFLEQQNPFWKNVSFWAASVFTFALSSQKTINWVINLETYLASAPVLVSFYILTVSRRWPAWITSAILTAFASLSFGMGLAGWLAIPLFLRGAASRQRLPFAAFWGVSACAVITMYFAGFPGFMNDKPFNFLAAPWESMHFLLTFMGAIFHPLQAEVFGVMGLVAFAAATVSHVLPGKFFTKIPTGLYAVMLFVLINGFMIAFSRVHFGATYALADRYMPLSCLFWGAVAVWLPSWRFLGRPLVCLLVFCVLLISPIHWMNAEDNCYFLREAAREIQKIDPDPAKLLELYEIPGIVESAIPLLKDNRMSVFK